MVPRTLRWAAVTRKPWQTRVHSGMQGQQVSALIAMPFGRLVAKRVFVLASLYRQAGGNAQTCSCPYLQQGGQGNGQGLWKRAGKHCYTVGLHCHVATTRVLRHERCPAVHRNCFPLSPSLQTHHTPWISTSHTSSFLPPMSVRHGGRGAGVTRVESW